LPNNEQIRFCITAIELFCIMKVRDILKLVEKQLESQCQKFKFTCQVCQFIKINLYYHFFCFAFGASTHRASTLLVQALDF